MLAENLPVQPTISSRAFLVAKGKQLCGFDLESFCETSDRIETDAVALAFQSADVGPITTSSIGQRFLRHALIGPVSAQVLRKNLSQVHVARQAIM